MCGSTIRLSGKRHHYKDALDRIIPLGPKAIAILKRYLRPDTAAPLFSPREAYQQRLTAMRAAAQPKYPSWQRQRKPDPLVNRSDTYTTETLRRAIHYACDLAGVSHRNPNQLRHAAATRLRKTYGTDGARVMLGHTTAGTTELYLDSDVQAAMKIAREVG